MRTWLDISFTVPLQPTERYHTTQPKLIVERPTNKNRKPLWFCLLWWTALLFVDSLCSNNLLILLHGKMPKSGAGDVSRYHQPGGALLAVLEGLAICGRRGRQHSRPFRGMKGGARWRWKNKSPFWLWTYELDFKDGGFVKQGWANSSALTSFLIAKKRRSTIN